MQSPAFRGGGISPHSPAPAEGLGACAPTAPARKAALGIPGVSANLKVTSYFPAFVNTLNEDGCAWKTASSSTNHEWVEAGLFVNIHWEALPNRGVNNETGKSPM